MRESYIQANVIAYARRKGCLAYKFNSSSQRGVPDFIIISPKVGVKFIEFKRKGFLPTELQTHVFSKFKERGQQVYIIDDIETGKSFIDEII